MRRKEVIFYKFQGVQIANLYKICSQDDYIKLKLSNGHFFITEYIFGRTLTNPFGWSRAALGDVIARQAVLQFHF